MGTRIVIVAGPPGSGNTTWVQKHMRHGDLVVDVDALFVALSGLDWYDKPVGLLPFVMEARDAVIARLRRESDVANAWVITGKADVRVLRDMKKELRAEQIVVMDTQPNECHRRIANDDRRAEFATSQRELINEWFKKFYASGGNKAGAYANEAGG